MVSSRVQQCRLAAVFGAVLGLVLISVGSFSAQASPDGERLFVGACAACHSWEQGAPHRQGPNLFGVAGKAAAQAADFKYSDALKSSGLVWDDAALDTWLTDAQAARPGTIMLYRQANPERRKLVIEYLKSLK